MQDFIEKLRSLQVETAKVNEAYWDHIDDTYDMTDGMNDILEVLIENVHEFSSTEAAMSVVNEVLKNAQMKRKKHHKRNKGNSEA